MSSDGFRELLARDLGGEDEAEDLLAEAAEHLQIGDLTALIVVDEIPRQLRRLVEFVNDQSSFELLAMKVEVVLHADSRLFIPAVVGQTVAKAASTPLGHQQWDRESFIKDLAERCTDQELRVAEAVLAWADDRGFPIRRGKGHVYGTFYPKVPHGSIEHPTMAAYSGGSLEVGFGGMDVPPFDTDQGRLELLRRLNEVAGVNLREDRASTWTSFPMAVLVEGDALNKFLAVWDWYADEIRTHPVAQDPA